MGLFVFYPQTYTNRRYKQMEGSTVNEPLDDAFGYKTEHAKC